jgi:hypothetical protein
MNKDERLGSGLTSMARAPAYANNLLWRAIAAMMCLIGNSTELQLIPVPSAGMRRHVTGTLENPFFPESLDNWHEV